MSSGTTSDNWRFVEAANPHGWLVVADELHAQAVSLRRSRGQSRLLQVGEKGGVEGNWDVTDRTAFLLGGLALENALKAFLVYENPEWVARGRLARPLKTHRLSELHRLANNVPYKRRYLSVLLAFEDGLEGWARYPSGVDAASTRPRGTLGDQLWGAYLRLIRAYGRRLVHLLSEDVWHGPDGYSGRWVFQGEFLSVDGQD